MSPLNQTSSRRSAQEPHGNVIHGNSRASVRSTVNCVQAQGTQLNGKPHQLFENNENNTRKVSEKVFKLTNSSGSS